MSYLCYPLLRATASRLPRGCLSEELGERLIRTVVRRPILARTLGSPIAANRIRQAWVSIDPLSGLYLCWPEIRPEILENAALVLFPGEKMQVDMGCPLD